MSKPGLYIHIPFCKSKCPYCSFVSFDKREDSFDAYLVALQKEASGYKGLEVSTVYIGGGTPTLLDKKRLEFLFSIIRVNFSFSSDVEITMEANPATFDLVKAEVLRDCGVNRVSLGVQSLDDRFLKFLKRPYDSREVFEAVEILKQANFKNINLDLMYGLPEQTSEDVLGDVQGLISLGCPHLSLYTLSIEAGSEFYRNHKIGLSQDQQADFFRLVKDGLGRSGFRHYEVSNFARPGYECRHNMNYWRAGSYLGLGVAAHSYRDDVRSWNTAQLDVYMGLLHQGFGPRAGEEKLDSSGRLMESFLIGLRLTEGVDLKALETRHGTRISHDKKLKLLDFVSQGFLINEGDCFKTTVEGMMVLDELCSRLV